MISKLSDKPSPVPCPVGLVVKNGSKENLGYVREDKLRKILDRGKIKGRIEYELVIDSIVVAEQEERITKQEATQLSEMIGEFETRRKNKK